MNTIKWQKILDIPPTIDGNVLTYLVQEYSIDVNLFKKYIPKEFINGTVFRFKNKRVVIIKIEDECFEVIVEKYEVVPDAQKQDMINSGWIYKNRNVWYHRMLFRKDTMRAISIAYERLKNVDV